MGVKSVFAGSLTLAMLFAAAEQGCSADVQTATQASSSTSGATAGSGGQGTGVGTGGGSGGNPSGTGAGGTAVSSATATSGTGGAGGCVSIRACQTHVYQCGDGLDNDGDGLIDSDDPECLGACDSTEGSYFGARLLSFGHLLRHRLLSAHPAMKMQVIAGCSARGLGPLPSTRRLVPADDGRRTG